MKSELLFYQEYEEFYAMAAESEAFCAFCADAFGQDFSQDGFSDLEQIKRLLKMIPGDRTAHILDIGCGNGKMLHFLQQETGAVIYGFDYSEHAICTAKRRYTKNAEFRCGIMGEIEYPDQSFDVVISMDTIYFAEDMAGFAAQVKRWMKADAIFFIGYQEGDVVPKTKDACSTQIAKALEKAGLSYDVCDITEDAYQVLRKKRRAALAHREAFEREGNRKWFTMLLFQTEYAECSLEEFREKMARYIYVARK